MPFYFIYNLFVKILIQQKLFLFSYSNHAYCYTLTHQLMKEYNLAGENIGARNAADAIDFIHAVNSVFNVFQFETSSLASGSSVGAAGLSA